MTAALVHILREYPYFQNRLVARIFEKEGREAPGELSIDAQVSMECDGGAEHSNTRQRPDIVFTDHSGDASPVLILENKLKYGCKLTENQPVNYIGLLAKDRPAGMVVVAPESQIPYYKGECYDRCKKAGLMDPGADHLKNPKQFLSFLSWQQLVQVLCESDGAPSAGICDLSQLKGLLNQMEETEITPFSIGDFEQIRHAAGRLSQLNRILVRIGQELPKRFIPPPRQGIAKGAQWEAFLREPDLAREDGINLLIKGKRFWLLPDFRLLSKSCAHPNLLCVFWLRIGFDQGWRNKGTSEPEQRSIRLALEKTTGIVVDEPRRCFSMAIPFRADDPEERILQTVIESIEQLDTNLGGNIHL